jgi:uracil-DNA glycosylase
MATIDNKTEFSHLHQQLTEESWIELLQDEFKKPYWSALTRFLDAEHASGKKVYPPKSDIFNAFNNCSVGAVRVVILGQDPYVGPGEAHGFSFSVKPGVRIPPSLVNIFTELQNDLKPNFKIPSSGDLTTWAQQGIFLLNTSLTVRAGQPASHSQQGWQAFTSAVITKLTKKHPHLIFVLWGRDAQQAARSVDTKIHYVLSSPHPSPKSADRGFFGSRFASKINRHLAGRGQSPINWNLDKDNLEENKNLV